MSEKVFKSLDATIEAGSIDLLVEVVEGGPSVYANLVITSEEDVEKDPPTFDLNRKDVLAVRDLMHSTLDAMSAAQPEQTSLFYDAIRLLMVTHYNSEEIESMIEDQGGVFDCTDLFERGMLASHAIGDTGEYDCRLTLKGRIHIEQAFTRLVKEGV